MTKNKLTNNLSPPTPTPSNPTRFLKRLQNTSCLTIVMLVHGFPFVGNLDFENLSNSLFHEWNNFANTHDVAITDDCKAATQTTPPLPPSISSSSTLTAPPLATMQRNRSELETIFTRVGLQMTVASKLADEVYEKLGLPPDTAISLTDFLSLIHCNSDSDARQWSTQSNAMAKHHSDTEYSLNPLNDHMITDLHAASGLLLDSKQIS